jgi:hypothetical protein
MSRTLPLALIYMATFVAYNGRRPYRLPFQPSTTIAILIRSISLDSASTVRLPHLMPTEFSAFTIHVKSSPKPDLLKRWSLTTRCFYLAEPALPFT